MDTEKNDDFLDDSFSGEEGEKKESEEKSWKFKKPVITTKLIIAIVGVFFLFIVAGFASLIFVPEMSNSEGIIGNTGMWLNKTLNTEFYQTKKLNELRNDIKTKIKNHNALELINAKNEITLFLANSSLNNAKALLLPLIFSINLEYYDNTGDIKVMNKLDKDFPKINNIKNYDYFSAYYYYLKSKYTQSLESINKKQKLLEPEKLLKGKILRALGKYEEASLYLDPSKYSDKYSFIAYKENGYMLEIRNNYKEAINNYENGIKKQ